MLLALDGVDAKEIILMDDGWLVGWIGWQKKGK